jgi:hypothetical protein
LRVPYSRKLRAFAFPGEIFVRNSTGRTTGVVRFRRAITTIEIILALPIFLLAVLAIVEFGLLFSHEQIVEMASRAGAQVASQLVSIPVAGDVPAEVDDAVARELEQIGVSDYALRLEHNIDFSGGSGATMDPVVLTSSANSGPADCPDPPALTLTPNRRYVRVTVCVYSTSLSPNVLSSYGLDLSQRVSDQTTLRRWAP